MENLEIHSKAARRAGGKKADTITRVVASGNLDVLLERVLPDTECAVTIATPLSGYSEIWRAVIDDFIERCSPGGLKISINDGGARPDVVWLRLAQGVNLMETDE